MTTRVLASSFHRLPLSPPTSSLAQRSVARLHAADPSLSRPVLQLSHARTPLPVSRPPRSSFSTSASSFAPHKNVLGEPFKTGPVAVAASLPSTSSSLWTRVAVGGTIALVTSAAVLNQLSKAPQLEANNSNSLGSSSLTGNIMLDLEDEHNKIGVEKKSNADLMLSMLVYKLCTFSLLVDLAPSLISIAEVLHLTPPVYWFVRKTFFAQFCG